MQSPFSYLFRFIETDPPHDMAMVRRMALRLTSRITSAHLAAVMHNELLTALERLANVRETKHEGTHNAQRHAVNCMYRTLVLARQ